MVELTTIAFAAGLLTPVWGVADLGAILEPVLALSLLLLGGVGNLPRQGSPSWITRGLSPALLMLAALGIGAAEIHTYNFPSTPVRTIALLTLATAAGIGISRDISLICKFELGFMIGACSSAAVAILAAANGPDLQAITSLAGSEFQPGQNGLAGNRNDAAFYAALAIAMAVAARRTVRRRALTLAYATLSAHLLLTSSRGGLLGLAIGLLWLLARSRSTSWRLRGVVALGLLPVLAVATSWRPSALLRTQQLASTDFGIDAGRLVVYETYVSLWRAQPWGLGLGFVAEVPSSGPTTPHNFILAAATYGGFLLAAVAICVSFATVKMANERSQAPEATLAASVALVWMATSSFPLDSPKHVLLLLVVLTRLRFHAVHSPERQGEGLALRSSSERERKAEYLTSRVQRGARGRSGSACQSHMITTSPEGLKRC